ncbi:MAG TPA: acyl-CoA thioesterase [Candidatus Eisenbacteria bacterium]|nr:acyl-CoA thioesterase [Candidatus Eisenbacteria bacterium]
MTSSPATTGPAKPASDATAEMIQIALPNDANVHGSVLGGTVMHWMDLAAAVAAHRHARRPVVTVCVDQITFDAPIRIGQLAILKAKVTLAATTSMEVAVEVLSEDLNGGIRRHTSTAYFTFVAIDAEGRPTPVPPLRLDTDEERAEHQRAQARREHRLALRRGGSRAG